MKKGPEIIWEHNRPGEASEICSLMKQWLREIPEGLIFGSSYEGFVKASGGSGASIFNHRSVIDRWFRMTMTDSSQDMISAAQKIVEPYRSTIIHLLRFLLLVTEHQASNKMSRTNMAIIFGPSLFKSPSRTGEYNSSDSSSALAENFLHVKWTEFLLSDFHTIFEPGTSKVRSLHVLDKKLGFF